MDERIVKEVLGDITCWAAFLGNDILCTAQAEADVDSYIKDLPASIRRLVIKAYKFRNAQESWMFDRKHASYSLGYPLDLARKAFVSEHFSCEPTEV